MCKVGLAIITLIIGIAVGIFAGAPLVGGAMAGVGAAAGISTGMCSTTKAAQDLGLLTAEQVDQVLNKASENISGKVDEQVVGSAEVCANFLAKNAN